MLKQKLILSYSSQIIFQALQVVASLVVARVAGPTVLGTVAFGTAYVSLWVFVADLGISTAHIKMVSEGRDIDRCVSTFAVLKLITTFLFISVIIGIYVTQKFVFDRSFESSVHETVIFIALAAVTVSQLFFIPKTTFSANTEQAKVEMPNLLQGFILHPTRIVVVLLGFGAVALAFASLASYLLVIPFYIYLFRNFKLHLRLFDKKLAKEYITTSLPIILVGMSTSMINQIDKVLLQFFTGSEQVGYYTAGYKVGGFILLIGKSVRVLFFPLFSKAVAEGNMHYIKDKISKFEKFSFLFIMPAVILIALFSRTFIVLLLGEQYQPSIQVMQLITIAMFILVLNMPFESVVEGLGKFKLSALISTLNLALFAALIVLFVSPEVLNLGAAGVALAILLSNLFVGLTFRFFATRNFKALNHSTALKFSLFGIVHLAAFYFIYEYIFDSDWLMQIAFVVIYLLTTYSLFTLFNWMSRKDWENLLSLVDFKSMKSYITQEIRK